MKIKNVFYFFKIVEKNYRKYSKDLLTYFLGGLKNIQALILKNSKSHFHFFL